MELFVKYIGYPLAKYLLDKLQLAVIHVYQDKLIESAGDSLDQVKKERNVIIKSISKATNNDDRRTLSVMLSKLPNS